MLARAAATARRAAPSAVDRPDGLFLASGDAFPEQVLLELLVEAERLGVAGGPDLLERGFEVGPRDLRRLEVLSDGGEAGLATEGREVASDVALRVGGELGEVDVVREGHPGRVHREDLDPTGDIRRLNEKQPVETAGPQEGFVDDVGTVGRGDDQDPLQRFEPVDRRE